MSFWYFFCLVSAKSPYHTFIVNFTAFLSLAFPHTLNAKQSQDCFLLQFAIAFCYNFHATGRDNQY